MTGSRKGRVDGAGGCPIVGAGIISAARVKRAAITTPAPDDHFAVGPHRSVTGSRRGRVNGAGWSPTIRAGIVSPAGVFLLSENPFCLFC